MKKTAATHKPKRTSLTVIAFSLSLVGTAQADNVSPFALSPLNLQSPAVVQRATTVTPVLIENSKTRPLTTTTIKGGGVKPNILLMLDNSASMIDAVTHDGLVSGAKRGLAAKNQPDATRAKVMVKSLTNVLNKYGDKGNFGIRWFNDNKGGVPVSQPIGTNVNTLISNINNVIVEDGTPSMQTYFAGINDFNGKIADRCQQNYVVMMSDGASTFNTATMNRFLKQSLGTAYRPYTNAYITSGINNYNTIHYGQWLELNELANKNAHITAALKAKYGTKNKTSNEYKSMCYTSAGLGTAYTNICNALPNEFVFYPYTGVSDTGSVGATVHAIADYTKKGYVVHTNPWNVDHFRTGVYMIPKGTTSPPVFPKEYMQAYAKDMFRYVRAAVDEYDIHNSGATDANGKAWTDGNFNRKIKTFTISFGAGVSASGQEFLKEGATPNITNKDGKNISYANATQDGELEAAFDAIFQYVEDQTPKTTGDAIITNGTGAESTPTSNNGTPSSASLVSQMESYASVAPSSVGGKANEIANMSATVFLPSGLASSELRFYDLNADGTVKKDANGVALYMVPDYSQRKALISTNSSNVLNNVVWSTELASSSMNNTTFKLPVDAQGRNDEWSAALLPWITRTGGKSDNEIRDLQYRGSQDSYRSRLGMDYAMGDVLDSPVVAAGDSVNERQEFLVTSANDGMVYLFQSNKAARASNNTSYNPYALKLNYLPATLARNGDETIGSTLQYITPSDYNKNALYPHKYLLNGGITVRTTQDEIRKDRIFMAGNAGQGARGMYALNVGGYDFATSPKQIALSNTDSAAWKSEVPLFEVNGKQETNLGYTVGSPQIARVKLAPRDVRQVVFLSSGFAYPDIDNQETALYLYDALGKNVSYGITGSDTDTSTAPGTRLGKADGDTLGGLATSTILDVNYDGIADYAFAGDYKGNMYRFDLRNVSAGIPVKKIFSGNPSQPITSAPAISYQGNDRFVVIFGTGSDIYETDYKNTDQQSVYGIYQKFESGTLNPVHPNGSGIPEPAILASGDLLEQTLSDATVEGSTSKFRTVTDNVILEDDKKTLKNLGWKVALGSNDGERVVVKPVVLFGTVFLTSRIYKEEENTQQTFDKTKGFDAANPTANGWEQDGEIVESERTYKPGPTADEWSEWVNVGAAQTTNTNVSGDKCLNTSSSSTQYQKATQTVEYTKTAKYQRVISSNTSSSGWLLTLKAQNGGQLKKENVGVDFARKGLNNDNLKDSDVFLSGIMLEGIPSSTLLTNFLPTDSAVTADGDSGGSGKELKLKDNDEAHDRGKQCIPAGKAAYLQASTTTEGLQDPFGIAGGVCKGTYSVRRLSWREIF